MHSARRLVVLARRVPSRYRASFTTSQTTSERSQTIIPGSSQYGSLGEGIPTPSSSNNATAWQAAHNEEVQRVTQKAMIYELIHEQTRTIESVVPWFLDNMPAA